MINKEKLYQYCLDWANAKIEDIQMAIQSSQDSANSETKSTAGDKHDTARAMMQLDVEQKSKQLAEAKKSKMALAQFNVNSGSSSISLGSLVYCNAATYYISISIGKIELENQTIFGISPVSPIAQAMKGLKAGDSFVFNGKSILIKSVK